MVLLFLDLEVAAWGTLAVVEDVCARDAFIAGSLLGAGRTIDGR